MPEMPNAAVIDETTLEELRRDAMRYRHMREQYAIEYEGQTMIVFWDGAAQLDAAIDAAMQP